MEGLVTKTTGADYEVYSKEGNYTCRIKGSFRIKGIKSTNPLTVGDIVEFNPESGYITALHDRRNYIVRKPANLSKQLHIIAANMDQCLLVVTIKNPTTATAFIDRVLATAEAYRIPAILAFNKIDTLDDDELEYLTALENLYHSIGYKTIRLSAKNGDGIDNLKEILQGKITLLSGNSGVGKSTILNLIAPEFAARTGEISSSHHKGMHTTTFSEMYEIGEKSYLIDTPGIKGFGMVNMEIDEIAHYFPEIFKESKNCRFNNCSHTHEPGCAVLNAIENHTISQSRYQSYLSIRENLNEGKYR
ncbi:MAG: ribosome small subunit-dependent GTPase A [bacterium]